MQHILYFKDLAASEARADEWWFDFELDCDARFGQIKRNLRIPYLA